MWAVKEEMVIFHFLFNAYSKSENRNGYPGITGFRKLGERGEIFHPPAIPNDFPHLQLLLDPFSPYKCNILSAQNEMIAPKVKWAVNFKAGNFVGTSRQ